MNNEDLNQKIKSTETEDESNTVNSANENEKKKGCNPIRMVLTIFIGILIAYVIVDVIISNFIAISFPDSWWSFYSFSHGLKFGIVILFVLLFN